MQLNTYNSVITLNNNHRNQNGIPHLKKRNLQKIAQFFELPNQFVKLKWRQNIQLKMNKIYQSISVFDKLG